MNQSIYKKEVSVSNQIELYKVIIRFNSYLHSIKISISHETILAYFCAFGINRTTYNYILQDRVVSSYQVLMNDITDLSNLGLIVKQGKGKVVHKDLRIDIVDNKALVVIKLNCKENITMSINCSIDSIKRLGWKLENEGKNFSVFQHKGKKLIFTELDKEVEVYKEDKLIAKGVCNTLDDLEELLETYKEDIEL